MALRLRSDLEKQQQPFLWIVDDWPDSADPKEFPRWQAPGKYGHTLITTRNQNARSLGAALPLSCLSPEEAVKLLAADCPIADDRDREVAHKIAERLGHHTLALAVAGAMIAQSGYQGFLDFLQDSFEGTLDDCAEMEDVLPTGHERDIVRTLKRSLESLTDPERDVLRLTALLAPQPIPREFLINVLARADGVCERELKRRLALTLQRIANRSLLTLSDQAVSVHVLVSHALTVSYPALERAAVLHHVAVEAMDAAFVANVRDIRQHQTLIPLEPHAVRLSEAADDEPHLNLLLRLGWFYDERGAYRLAEAIWRKEMEGRQRLQGPEHPDTLTSMNNLALTLSAQGDHSGARALHEQVLELQRRVLGAEHPHTLTSMGNLAGTLGAQGDHSGAQALEEQVLEVRRRVLGPEHPDTLQSMNNLASTLYAQGDHSGARALHEQELEICRRVLGPEHPDTLLSMDNLSVTLCDLGEWERAEELSSQAVNGMKKVLGEDHPWTKIASRRLAIIRARRPSQP